MEIITSNDSTSRVRQVWVKPELVEYGVVSDVTAGAVSTGTTESGYCYKSPG